jgi:2-polyprenyl-3-methyl-5-hydroxy-6-metoxy-1,4-benzoquinol methylase
MTVTAPPMSAFEPIPCCWVCGGSELAPYHQCRMDFSQYEEQDPGLYAYTGRQVWLVHCRKCGFGQPDVLPTLPGFFERMYDQQWSDAWVEQEFTGSYKDLIFHNILEELETRVSRSTRRLLDVGAHAGRFMRLAQERGWEVEGVELNPRTAAYAAAHTGRPVHRMNAHALATNGRRYDAVVLTDVLEHVPEPMLLLATLASLLDSGGVIAIKVPNGHAQWLKEQCLAALTSHRVSLADNLVHVNHFSPRSLRQALERVGLSAIHIAVAAPELPTGGTLGRAARRVLFAAASLPGGLHTPLALHLQAYAVNTRR